VLSLVGLLLFPGFGTLGCTIAFGLSSLRLMARHQRAAPPTEIGGDDLPALPERPTDPLHDLAIEPLVDILRERDNTLRHAAIRLLGRRCDRESVALLRGLLTDPDPDIRSEASTTLFNFEMQLNRTLNDAIGRVRSVLQEADAYADLGATYSRFVRCGLLDGPSARLYLTRACTAFREATTLAPDTTAYWLALAEAERDLGETEAAARSVARARSLAPDDAGAHLLAMDLAFREQRWADLLAFAAVEEGSTPDAPEIAELSAWWAAHPSDQPVPVGIRRGGLHALAIVPEHEGVA
jgi:tetratricopeptide (TPR) repeat protein